MRLSPTLTFVFDRLLFFWWENGSFSGKMADHALGNSLQTYLTLQIRDISNQDSLNSDLLTSIIPTAYSDVIFTSSPCFTAGPNEYQWLLESSGKFSIKTTIGLFQSPPTSPLSYYLIWDPFLPDKFSLLCRS